MNVPPPCAPPLAAPDARSRWFAQEVHVHESSLRSYLRAAYPSVRDVDDVVQESFLRVWKARAAEPIRSVKSFLFSVARHLAVDFIRHEHASPMIAVTDLSALPVLDDRAGAAERASVNQEIAILTEAIDALPARCREIIILRKLQGISQKEIAARLGISEQTVQVQVVRGVKRCARFLRHRGVRTHLP